MESILITGASGFVGSFLVEEALRRGMETWAGVRSTSSRRYLQDSRIHFLELDFAHPDKLEAQLLAQGRFDYIIHCAGVTKCADPADFERVNYGQTRCFVETLIRLGQTPRRFVFVSTLSVFGPVHEDTYEPIKETDTPQPNTAYGRSKLKAERFLQGLTDFPCVILRPTGIYGPRERDYYLMAQSIERHVDVAAGFRRQDLTFVYVQDVVQASSRTFSDLIIRELGHPFVLRLTLPLCVLKAVSLFVGWLAGLRWKTSTLNRDKYHIMKQRNWQCDIAPAIRELGYRPAYDLDKGVREAVAWYKKEGWL